MSDDLTRAIAEAVIEEDVLDHHQWCESNYTSGCNCLSFRETTATKIAAALAPLIEAREREARATELEDVADAFASSANRVVKAKGETERTRYANEVVEVLRNRADEVRRA